MLNQTIFGEKLRAHRKNLGLTQEEAAAKIGVSGQAVSKWESGDCLPDCFNLKAICDLYGISADALLETELDGALEAVAAKIEQLGTEYIWANAKNAADMNALHRELGEDLLTMWKGLYFAETGDPKIHRESKARGNTRIGGPFGLKIWDDDGIVAVVKADLVKGLSPFPEETAAVMGEICSAEGQRLLAVLDPSSPLTKAEIVERAGVELSRLNELLLLFTENNIIEYSPDHTPEGKGYRISAHCGIAAYMALAAMYVMNKKRYEASMYLTNDRASLREQ